MRARARLQRRARVRSEPRPRALAAAASTPRTRAVLPVDFAGQPCDLDPICLARERVPRGRGRRARRRERLPRPQGRRDRRRDLLLALRDEERRRRRGRRGHDRLDELAAAVPELRLMRRGHGSLYDIRSAGFKANLSDVNAAIALVPARPARAPPRDPAGGTSPPTTRRSPSWPASSRSPATRATPTRSTSTSCASTRRPGRGDPRRLPARAHRGTDRHEHPLPPRAPADVLPRALSGSAAAAGRRAGRPEVLSLPLSPAHSARTSRTRSTRCGACTRGSPREALSSRRALA